MKDYVQSSFKLQINIRLDQHLHTITPIVLWLPSKLDIHINMFARITPLIIYLQIIVLVVLLNYYFNPTILTSHCLAGTPPSLSPCLVPHLGFRHNHRLLGLRQPRFTRHHRVQTYRRHSCPVTFAEF